MKIFYLIGISILLFVGCANLDLPTKHDKAKYDITKEQLIKDVNNGELKSMIGLNKLYHFPETKEGLFYFNKWYKIVEKSNDNKLILKIADIYFKYKDMFADGNNRVCNLYKKSYDMKKNLDVAVKILISSPYRKRSRERQFLNKIIGDLSKEQLYTLYTYYSKHYTQDKKATVFAMMEKKKFGMPFSSRFPEFKRNLFNANGKEKEKIITKFTNTLIASKNVDDLLATARFLKWKYFLVDALNLYELACKLGPCDAESFYAVSDIYKSKKNTKKRIEYLLKATKLGHETAILELVKLYSRKLEYIDRYYKLKTQLMKTQAGKLILAKRYGYNNKSGFADNLYNQAAKEGNEDAILELAFVGAYLFSPERYTLSKKWQKYILDSDNMKLKQKALEKMYIHSNNDKFGELISKLEKEIKENKKDGEVNILILGKIALKYRYQNPKLYLKYLKKAASYGDVFSKKALVKLYSNGKNKNYDKVVKILTSLMQDGDYDSGMRLADMYRYPPRGFKRDIKKAIKIYTKYAKKDDIGSMEKLQNIYTCDSCEENKNLDYDKGIFYTKKLIDLDDGVDNYATLGWIYQYGKHDVKTAKKYYQKAVEKGYYRAYMHLAFLYYNRDGKTPLIRTDHKKAKKYLEQCAQHDLKYCINLLGIFYEKGIGTKKDMSKAKEWFSKSNTKKAKEHLKNIY